MGVISALFGSTKLVEATGKLVESAPEALDKMILTDEEVRDFDAKKYDLWLKLQEIFAKENTSFAIARRVLAFIAFGYYFPMLAIAGVMMVLSVFVEPTFKEMNPIDLHWRLVGCAAYFKQMAIDQLPIVATISAFYYGPGIIDKFIGKKL